MNPARPHTRLIKRKYVRLAMALAAAYWFVSGPSGLVSILLRRHHERCLQAEIRDLRQRIADAGARRDWLANPDSASQYARRLLGPEPDSTTAPK